MASPPYSQSPTAMSPPFSHSQLPPINTMTSKKRTAEGGAAPPALKRRKPSTMSVGSAANSAHPLRQTSFPPDEVGTPFNFGGPRSPSVDMDAMSLVSGSQVSAAAPAKKKRGRKSKAEKAREQTPSVAGGRAATIISGISGGGKAAKSATGAAAAGGDDGEADDEGPTEVAVAADIVTKEQKDEEIRLKCMLVQALDPDQFHRYELWRAAGLNKINVRKLINATISQSVTDNVVIAMRTVVKVFIGDLVEMARHVQSEWIEKGERQTDLPTPPDSTAPSPNGEAGAATGAYEIPGDRRRGPLRPDHLREALRRYKLSVEGGGAGMHTLWHQQQQNGVARFPTRTGGRRIFR